MVEEGGVTEIGKVRLGVVERALKVCRGKEEGGEEEEEIFGVM